MAIPTIATTPTILIINAVWLICGLLGLSGSSGSSTTCKPPFLALFSMVILVAFKKLSISIISSSLRLPVTSFSTIILIASFIEFKNCFSKYVLVLGSFSKLSFNSNNLLSYFDALKQLGIDEASSKPIED
jgi:hypothetical protein